VNDTLPATRKPEQLRSGIHLATRSDFPAKIPREIFSRTVGIVEREEFDTPEPIARVNVTPERPLRTEGSIRAAIITPSHRIEIEPGPNIVTVDD
jgi:hypothetical protein